MYKLLEIFYNIPKLCLFSFDSHGLNSMYCRQMIYFTLFLYYMDIDHYQKYCLSLIPPIPRTLSPILITIKMSCEHIPPDNYNI